MSNRMIYILTFFVLVGICILLVINSTNVLNVKFTDPYLSKKDVRGTAIIHQGKEYTLNFAQQNALIDYLNASQVQVNQDLKVDSPADFEKIVIYLFEVPNVEIIPIGYSKNNLIFTSEKWNAKGQFIDTSNGQLKELLSGTYDK